MSIELNTNKQATQLSNDMLAQFAKVANDGTKAKEVLNKALEVLAGSNLRVTNSDNTTANGVGEKKTTGATSVPALDNPDDAKAKVADLMKLISYLQLDNQERQTEMAKDRINMQKDGLDVEHKDRMKQIEESIKKMEKAEKASKISRIFGWIGAVLAVAAAVALTIVTGGAAAGFAIAGAVVAVTALTLNETGAMDKIVEGLAEKLQSTFGMDKNKAMLAASLIVNLSIMALQLGCCIGSMVSSFAAAGKAAADAAATGAKAVGEGAKISATTMQAAKTVQNVITVANTAVSGGSLGVGAASTYLTYKSESVKADTTELEKFMTMLQQRLEESQEELQKILEQIQAGIGKIAEMISSSTDTSEEIAQRIGQMA